LRGRFFGILFSCDVSSPVKNDAIILNRKDEAFHGLNGRFKRGIVVFSVGFLHRPFAGKRVPRYFCFIPVMIFLRKSHLKIFHFFFDWLENVL